MILDPTRWFISLTSKLARVVPLRTSWVILFTLIAQVSYILAFFLPLKIVILLGSEGIPRYFPPAFAQYDRDLIVVTLSIATVVFFVMNVVSEKIIEKITASATQVLLKRSHKLALFKNQGELAADAYGRFSRALSALVFSGLAIFGLLFIYPEMALVMAGFITLAMLVTLTVSTHSEAIRDYLNTQLKAFTDYLNAFGFFVVFGFLIIDFIWLQPPNIIVAIIAILLGRQTFNRISRAVVDMTRLYGQRLKINALFFHGKALEPATDNVKDSFWSLMMRGNRSKWIAELLSEFHVVNDISEEEIEENLQWMQPSMPQIGMFLFRYDDLTYLIKLYDQKKMLVSAQHSITLLSEAPQDLPAPEFIGHSYVKAFPCALYKLESGKAPGRKYTRELKLIMYARLMAVQPSTALTQRYLRSHSTIVGRMNIEWLDRVKIALRSDSQQLEIEYLRTNWPRLKTLLNNLPLAFHNPSINPSDIWLAQGLDSPLFLNWERWSLEPVGAGWPTTGKAFESLSSAHKEVAKKRSQILTISVEHIMLAALVYEFERHMNKQRLSRAIEVVGRIWRLFEPLLLIDANQASAEQGVRHKEKLLK